MGIGSQVSGDDGVTLDLMSRPCVTGPPGWLRTFQRADGAREFGINRVRRSGSGAP
ncbi:hypothetical protein BCE75_11378 [Isoptericola sp. CG 20/1183]|uniref:Uncharacterized protein n=1 Tax=Isoptericola halotolerans TaxID=300560 RepID=A0ABX5EAA2_9MICO|nr:hypothetical protein BCE75_11378 [Isoptericola sp. CG 20/1183]PRZ03765.1 hypothetical protein BCL65_11278 [Isoptericola halotolerans]